MITNTESPRGDLVQMLASLEVRGIHWANESFTRLLYSKLVTEGDTVLDVGASEGIHVVELSRLVGPAGRVHAFEPNFAHYKRLLSISENVRLRPLALGRQLAIATLSVPEGLDGWASLHDLEGLLPEHTLSRLTVIQAPLDALDVPVSGRLPFVKIDAERSELDVVRGATKLLQRHRPVMAVENVTAELLETMASLEYAAADFFGAPFGSSECLSSLLPNTVLLPKERVSGFAFLDPASQEVLDVLVTCRNLDHPPVVPETPPNDVASAPKATSMWSVVKSWFSVREK